MVVGFSNIGEAIRAARLALGLTQDELAARLEMTQGTISRVERGSDLRLGTLVEVARELRLEVMLVPRSTVPAIRAILGTGSASAGDAAHIDVYDPADGRPYSEGDA